MNGIEKITKEIASEAEAEITSVLTAAEASASALTEEYAAKIGADYYSRDAKSGADIARETLG